MAAKGTLMAAKKKAAKAAKAEAWTPPWWLPVIEGLGDICAAPIAWLVKQPDLETAWKSCRVPSWLARYCSKFDDNAPRRRAAVIIAENAPGGPQALAAACEMIRAMYPGPLPLPKKVKA